MKLLQILIVCALAWQPIKGSHPPHDPNSRVEYGITNLQPVNHNESLLLDSTTYSLMGLSKHWLEYIPPTVLHPALPDYSVTIYFMGGDPNSICPYAVKADLHTFASFAASYIPAPTVDEIMESLGYLIVKGE